MQTRIIPTLAALAFGCLGAGAQSNLIPATPPNQPNELVTTRSDDGSVSTRLIVRNQQNSALAQVADAEEQLNAAQNVFQTVKIFDEGRARNHAILISSTQTNAEALSALDEDLRVMSHLLDKTVSGGAPKEQEQMLGIYVAAQSGGRGPQSLYLEGQGVVLIRTARIALLPGETKKAAKGEAKRDSAWEEAKREVDGPKPGWKLFDGSYKPDTASRREFVPYDAEKVESLKRDIVGVLKNAANIRGLGETESVTVVLLGGPEAGGANPGDPARTSYSAAPSRFSAGRPATMTIRVKKADAMAAQSGAIDSAELQKRSVISVY